MNLDHLVTKDAEFHLPTFLRFYHEQQLLPAALEPGYPVETVNHALALWIAWILHNTAGK